jgi:CheY-like chemotaxis protein
VDIGLPDIDGYEVARRVRKAFPDGAPRLVAMSGFAQPEDRARALEAAFDLHLVKPVEPDDLRKLLGDAGGRDRTSRGVSRLCWSAAHPPDTLSERETQAHSELRG